MAQIIDLPDFVRGDTWTNKLTFNKADGSPEVITGWQFWLTLKLDPTADDDDAAAQVMVTADGADALAGVVYLTLDPAETEVLLPTTYRYDTQYSRGPGHVRTISLGRVKVIADMTRSR